MKKFFLLLSIFLMANTAFADQLIKIDTANITETQNLFTQENLRIHYYHDSFAIATAERNLAISHHIVDENPWQEGFGYYLLWLDANTRSNYIADTEKFAQILYEGQHCLIVKVAHENARKLSPAIHNGVIRINNIDAKLPQPISFGSRDVEENPFIYELMELVNPDSLLSFIQHLEDFGSRNCYEIESVMAQNWIQEKYESFGLETEIQDFWMPNGEASDNVIAILPGTLTPDEYIVMGGHYDSLNYSGPCPGADDNASGTCGVMEIARVLSQFTFDKTLVFCAFSGEEYGLYGSEAYAAQAQEDGMNILGYLNMDMVGYRHPGDEIHTDMINPNSAQELADFYEDVAGVYLPNFGVYPGNLIGGDSDHTSFNNHGYMGIFPFEDSENHSPHIHTANDLIGPSVNSIQMATTFTKAILAAAVTMAVPHSAKVEGQVLDSVTGNGIPAHIVDNMTQRSIDTDPSGQFDMYLIPGERTFTVQSFGHYSTETASITPSDTAVTYVNISLAPLPDGTLSGITTDAATGQAIASAQISFPGIPIDPALSNDVGVYNFPLIPGDWNYEIQITADEYEQINQMVFINGDTSTELDFTMNFVEQFENSDAGFVGERDWEWGIPTANGGPAQTQSGQKCWGTNLDGNYSSNAYRFLYSNISTIGYPDEAGLKFYHWYECNEGWDGGNVQIKINDEDWQLIYPQGDYPDASVIALSGQPGFTGVSNGWEAVHFDISNMVSVGDEIQFRFLFATTNSHERGWFIDDFTVHGNTQEISALDDTPQSLVPSVFRLEQNYPNPFNPNTTIQFEIPQLDGGHLQGGLHLTLNIYDLSGKLIKTLIDKPMDAGYHSVIWDGKTNGGTEAPSGVYVYTIDTGIHQSTKSMILLK